MTGHRQPYVLFVGTYSLRNGRGLYRVEFDAAAARWGALQTAFDLPNASFQALHPAGRFLYSVCEERETGRRTNGSVCALAIEPGTGRLILLNRRRTLGDGPCHVCLTAGGRQALVSNYVTGSVVVFPILADGSLGEASSFVQHHGGSGVVPDRQEGPHAHSTLISPDQRHVFAADLGQDRIRVSRFNALNGELLPADPPEMVCAPGSGPRHLAMHPAGRWLYLVHELDNSLAVLDYDAPRGILTPRQTHSTLPPGWTGTSYAADVHLSPDGRFLYASNRGHDSLAVFAVDPAGGDLELRGFMPARGRWPRQFGMTLDGRILFAANQESDSLAAFSIDPETGSLTPWGETLAVPAPVCVTVGAGGRFSGLFDAEVESR